jgi:hypothetical protein
MSGKHRSTTGPGKHHLRTSRTRAPNHADGDGDGDGDDLQAGPATSEPLWPTTRDLARIELLVRVRDALRNL